VKRVVKSGFLLSRILTVFWTTKQKSFVQPINPEQANKARWLYDLIMYLMRPFEVEAIGLDKLPEGQICVTPNHQKLYDAFAVMCASLGALQRHSGPGWVGIAFR